MKPEQFKEIVNGTFTKCCDLLRLKEVQYSDGKDRLIQFYKAANLSNTTPTKALAGMMVKHTTKLYQMLDEDDSNLTFGDWDEVILDHINYLFLLSALITDNATKEIFNDNF